MIIIYTYVINLVYFLIIKLYKVYYIYSIMKRSIYGCYTSVKPHQRHITVYFLFFIFVLWFIGWHLLSPSLDLGVTLFPILQFVYPLNQTLWISLLYWILIVIDWFSLHLKHNCNFLTSLFFSPFINFQLTSLHQYRNWSIWSSMG